jgi:Sulfotransferase family
MNNLNKKSKKPIIVVGMNRSGTKWLSNIFLNHSEICGIQSENDRGIIETNLFGNMQAKFDLTILDDYLGFVQLWSHTNFFKRTNFEKEIFYKLNPRPTNYLEMFKLVMDNYAIKENKNYWLQKSSPKMCEELLEYFENAFFIYITRDIVDNLKSTFALRNKKLTYEINKTVYSFYRQIFVYVLKEKKMKKCMKMKRNVYITYDKLKNNHESEVRKICDAIGITFEPQMLIIPFKMNTSFNNNQEREQIFSKSDEFKIRLFYKFLSLIPYSIIKFLKAIGHIKYILTINKPTPFTPGTFSDIKFKFKIK